MNNRQSFVASSYFSGNCHDQALKQEGVHVFRCLCRFLSLLSYELSIPGLHADFTVYTRPRYRPQLMAVIYIDP